MTQFWHNKAIKHMIRVDEAPPLQKQTALKSSKKQINSRRAFGSCWCGSAVEHHLGKT